MKLIYDIGAHNGSDTEFYLKKGFQVIAIEPNPYCCKIMRDKFKKELSSGQLIIEEFAISNQVGPINFYINKTHNDWGALYEEWNTKYQSELEEVVVIGKRLPEILGDSSIYYIKIDIEGSDLMCVKQLIGGRIPKFLSVELLTYNNFSETESSSEIFYTLKSLGYTKFQLIDQSINHKVKCPNPSLEGIYVDFHFDGYCTGLFGKELPDKWVSMDIALMEYLNYFYNKTHQNSWFDLHCTK
jgi:FkbM family methyltransferase